MMRKAASLLSLILCGCATTSAWVLVSSDRIFTRCPIDQGFLELVGTTLEYNATRTQKTVVNWFQCQSDGTTWPFTNVYRLEPITKGIRK